LSAVRDCLFNIFAATLHIWRLLHPQPEDAPCRGDRDNIKIDVRQVGWGGGAGTGSMWSRIGIGCEILIRLHSCIKVNN
jgi:hypothetical protein